MTASRTRFAALPALIAAAMLAFFPSRAQAQVALPNTFVVGDLIDPNRMNANFTAVKNAVDPLLVSAYTMFTGLNNAAVTVGTTATVLGTPAMTVTKQRADTKLEIHVNSNFSSGTFTGASWIMFDVQVDGAAANVVSNSGNIQTSATMVFLTMDAVFSGLAAGSHTVTLVGHVNSGTSTSVTVDSGGWNGAVIVKEVF